MKFHGKNREMLGLKESVMVGNLGIAGVVLTSLASHFLTNRCNRFDIDQERRRCIICEAERSHRARSYNIRLLRQELEKHEEDVDGSVVDLLPCKYQVLITVNASHGFQPSLDFLPCENGVWILGSSNGLLLCSTHKWYHREWGQTQYYLCNPLNNHWIALPPTPKSMCVNFLGFVFDPCSNFGNPDLHQPLPCSKTCMFKVLRKPMMSFQFEVEIFSSDVGQWSMASLPSPNACPRKVGYLFHNGCLYWPEGGRHPVVYDPYNKKLRGLIPSSKRSQLCQDSSLLGPKLSRSSIWLFQIASMLGT